MPDTGSLPGSGLLFITEFQPLFEGYHTHFYLDTIHRHSQMRAKAPMGRVKAGPTLTVPQRHTHTHTKSNAETQFLSLYFRSYSPIWEQSADGTFIILVIC